VQVVQQDPYGSLNPGLNIEDALGAALLYHRMVGRKGLRDELLRVLQEVGLDATPAFLRRYPHQLSGGQRQRVAIARSMSLQPRVVVADEATSMLDVSMRVAILDLLLSFRKQRELAYLFISHDFGVVRYFSQGGRVIVMFYGVIVEQGPSEEVIRHPRHPYTYLLLQAIPIPDPVAARRRKTEELSDYVEGQPAAAGCVFANRCPFAEEQCRTSRPPLKELAPGHWAACWFPERVPAIDQSIQGDDHHDARSSSNSDPLGHGTADNGSPRAAAGTIESQSCG
jgi:oligopeptide/dipeptide ABC transporter ATP-binding protein